VAVVLEHLAQPLLDPLRGRRIGVGAARGLTLLAALLLGGRGGGIGGQRHIGGAAEQLVVTGQARGVRIDQCAGFRRRRGGGGFLRRGGQGGAGQGQRGEQGGTRAGEGHGKATRQE